jgi:hypothetical protein
MLPHIELETKARMAANVSATKRGDLSADLRSGPKSAAIVAAQVGTSTRSMEAGKAVHRDAVPEVWAARCPASTTPSADCSP